MENANADAIKEMLTVSELCRFIYFNMLKTTRSHLSDLLPLDLLERALPHQGQALPTQVGHLEGWRKSCTGSEVWISKWLKISGCTINVESIYQSGADSSVQRVQRSAIGRGRSDSAEFSCLPNLHQLRDVSCWVLIGRHLQNTKTEREGEPEAFDGNWIGPGVSLITVCLLKEAWKCCFSPKVGIYITEMNEWNYSLNF